MTSPAMPPKPRRSVFVTLLGVAAVLAGGLGSVFSAFALLLAIGKPYANANADLPGIFVIFILPPATLLAGIGLLLRQRWARWWMILIAAALLAASGKGLLSRGVAVEAVALAAVAALVLAAMFSRGVQAEFSSKPRPAGPPPVKPPPADDAAGWRVGHHGRDMMYYEERHGRSWQRIDISGEMLTGRAHHVIYFADEAAWRGYPEWARHRRDEIIARIKSRFREPDYEYDESAFPVPRPVATAPTTKDGSILPALGALLALAAGAFWLAYAGIESGETRLPAKHRDPRGRTGALLDRHRHDRRRRRAVHRLRRVVGARRPTPLTRQSVSLPAGVSTSRRLPQARCSASMKRAVGISGFSASA